jgi:hypothetical protein
VEEMTDIEKKTDAKPQFVVLADIGNIPFSSMVKIAWKWWWAFLVVNLAIAIPVAIVVFIAMWSLDNHEKM